MKVVNLPIECIVHNSKDGIPRPIRARLLNENKEEYVIRKIQTQSTEECKKKGKRYFKFVCQSLINDVLKVFELRFYLENCKWTLFKI